MKEKYEKVKERFRLWFDKQNLQTTIVLPFTISGLFVILIMTAALNLRFTNTVEDMVEEKNIQILEQTNQALNTYLKQMMKVSDTAYYEILKQKDTQLDGIYVELDLLYKYSFYGDSGYCCKDCVLRVSGLRFTLQKYFCERYFRSDFCCDLCVDCAGFSKA